jgi:adenine/guanine/hypoxanthine permease
MGGDKDGKGGIKRFFAFEALGTNYRREIVGGLTTFVTMAYIIVVNPAILAAAGIPVGPSTIATILAAAIGTLAMGLYAKRPIGVAPYMGENAFIAFTVCLGMGFTWQQGLGAVFIGGVIFVVITAFRLRVWLARSIPPSLRYGFAAAIGLFLAFIGLYESGIVTSFVSGMPVEALTDAGSHILNSPSVPVKMGQVGDPRVLLALLCFVLIVLLMALKVHGAMLIGMAFTAVIGFLAGQGSAPTGIVAMPFVGNYSIGAIALKLDIAGALSVAFIPVLLTIFLMDFLDTIGTLYGVGAAGDLLDENGDFPDMQRPMMADAVASVAGALLGTTTTGAYIESATGIKEGARSGFAAVVTALAFVVCLFFIPLIQPLQGLTFVYGPPLVVVGILMLGSIRRIDFDELTECVPAVVTILLVIFTYNIGNGLTAGIVAYTVLKTAVGRYREVSGGMWVLSALSLVYYVFGVVH